MPDNRVSPAAFGWIISDFVADDVPGIIIDTRGNQGGLDAAGVSMLSHFINEPIFYQDLAPVVDGNLVIDPERRDIVEPSDVVFDGPVVVLVDSHTLSVGEGLPTIMQRLPQGTVIGMESTGAAFAQGDFDALFRLPDGLVFSFLERASLDAEGNVQVDSNATGTGGITPDLMAPMTEANIAAIFVDGTDVVLETAVDYLKGNS